MRFIQDRGLADAQGKLEAAEALAEAAALREERFSRDVPPPSPVGAGLVGLPTGSGVDSAVQCSMAETETLLMLRKPRSHREHPERPRQINGFWLPGKGEGFTAALLSERTRPAPLAMEQVGQAPRRAPVLGSLAPADLTSAERFNFPKDGGLLPENAGAFLPALPEGVATPRGFRASPPPWSASTAAAVRPPPPCVSCGPLQPSGEFRRALRAAAVLRRPGGPQDAGPAAEGRRGGRLATVYLSAMPDGRQHKTRGTLAFSHKIFHTKFEKTHKI